MDEEWNLGFEKKAFLHGPVSGRACEKRRCNSLRKGLTDKLILRTGYRREMLGSGFARPGSFCLLQLYTRARRAATPSQFLSKGYPKGCRARDQSVSCCVSLCLLSPSLFRAAIGNERAASIYYGDEQQLHSQCIAPVSSCICPRPARPTLARSHRVQRRQTRTGTPYIYSESTAYRR